MCVRCGTGRIAWCTDPTRHGDAEPPSVTDGDIGRLMFQAREVRNYLLAERCRQALAGDAKARETVVKVITGTYHAATGEE